MAVGKRYSMWSSGCFACSVCLTHQLSLIGYPTDFAAVALLAQDFFPIRTSSEAIPKVRLLGKRGSTDTQRFEGECYKCGRKGHMKRDCRSRGSD